jgi:hypothetical protein
VPTSGVDLSDISYLRALSARIGEVRLALRYAGAETKFAAVAAPSSSQLARRLAHRHRHPDCAQRRVGTRHRIAEEHHDPVARQLVERALEMGGERPQGAMIFTKEVGEFSSGLAVSVKAV